MKKYFLLIFLFTSLVVNAQNETIDNIERHKKLIFRGQRWHNISKEATEFIQSLLTPNPKKR